MEKGLSSQTMHQPIPAYPDEQSVPPPSYTAEKSLHLLKLKQNEKCGEIAGHTTIGFFGPLPEPLLLRITGFLDPLSKECLRLTNNYFHNFIQTSKTEMTGCAKWLVMAYLEREFLDRVAGSATSSERRKHNIKLPFMKRSSSSSLPNNVTKLTCSLCKTKHGPNSFLKGAARSQALLPKNTTELLHQRSLQRICAWHYGKIVRVKFVEYPKHLVFFGRWISEMQLMCLHCGMFVERDKCGCQEKCAVCPTVSMRIYKRIRRSGETGAIEWTFKRDEDGGLSVNEDRTTAKGKEKVRMPIEYR